MGFRFLLPVDSGPCPKSWFICPVTSAWWQCTFVHCKALKVSREDENRQTCTRSYASSVVWTLHRSSSQRVVAWGSSPSDSTGSSRPGVAAEDEAMKIGPCQWVATNYSSRKRKALWQARFAVAIANCNARMTRISRSQHPTD